MSSLCVATSNMSTSSGSTRLKRFRSAASERVPPTVAGPSSGTHQNVATKKLPLPTPHPLMGVLDKAVEGPVPDNQAPVQTSQTQPLPPSHFAVADPDPLQELEDLRHQLTHLRERLSVFQDLAARRDAAFDAHITRLNIQMAALLAWQAEASTKLESLNAQGEAAPQKVEKHQDATESPSDSESDNDDVDAPRPASQTVRTKRSKSKSFDPAAAFPVLVPSRTIYNDAVSFQTYRLTNRSQAYDSSVSARISSWTKRMSHSFQTDKFTGSDPIRIINFLKSFRDAANHNNAPEEAAGHVLPYFLEGPAAS